MQKSQKFYQRLHFPLNHPEGPLSKHKFSSARSKGHVCSVINWFCRYYDFLAMYCYFPVIPWVNFPKWSQIEVAQKKFLGQTSLTWVRSL